MAYETVEIESGDHWDRVHACARVCLQRCILFPPSIHNHGQLRRRYVHLVSCTNLTLTSYSDEVAALVLDIGTSTLRAGYAGDDAPKAIIPTSYGFITEEAPPSNGDVQMSEAGASEGEQPLPRKGKAKLYLGQNGPSLWRSGMQVGNPMNDGLGVW